MNTYITVRCRISLDCVKVYVGTKYVLFVPIASKVLVIRMRWQFERSLKLSDILAD